MGCIVLVRCVLVLRCGLAGVVWYPYAGWGTTHEITQQTIRKLLRMDVLTSETCWALNKEIIKQVTSSWSLFTQLSNLIVTLHIFLLTDTFKLYSVFFSQWSHLCISQHGRTDLLITRSDVIFRRTLEYTVNWAFPLPSTTQEQLSRRWPLYGHVSGATNLLQCK